jgi:hypothetical protein
MLPLTEALVPHSWKKLLVLGRKNQQHRRWTMDDGRWTIRSGAAPYVELTMLFASFVRMVLSSPYILDANLHMVWVFESIASCPSVRRHRYRQSMAVVSADVVMFSYTPHPIYV